MFPAITVKRLQYSRQRLRKRLRSGQSRPCGRVICCNAWSPERRSSHPNSNRSDQKMRTRLKDIAERLSLSVVTVSKVLRNQSDISPETKARVLRMMKELNHQPNQAARSLATGRTFSVGLIVPSSPSVLCRSRGGHRPGVEPRRIGLFISSAEEIRNSSSSRSNGRLHGRWTRFC